MTKAKIKELGFEFNSYRDKYMSTKIRGLGMVDKKFLDECSFLELSNHIATELYKSGEAYGKQMAKWDFRKAIGLDE